jgi:hypothetical protein
VRARINLFLRFHEPFNEQAFRFLEPLRGRKVPESYKLRSAGAMANLAHARSMDSIRLFGERVIPHFRIEAVWRRATEAGR